METTRPLVFTATLLICCLLFAATPRVVQGEELPKAQIAGYQMVIGIPTALVGSFLGLAITFPFVGINISGSGECDGWAPGTCRNDDAPLVFGWAIGGALATGLVVPVVVRGSYDDGRVVRSLVGAFAGSALALGLGMIPEDRNRSGGAVMLLSSLLTVPLGAALCFGFCPFLGPDTAVSLAPLDSKAAIVFSSSF